ncbi:MAG: AMP-binding protein [Hyphomicrobiales bacterium]|nr:AMP-binding protein [Hyphomicrobiales bacterium]MBV8824261.1 AMP-binding protein [Hyphomicrobiales bacterium]MBV9428583.1 AMP-binding protein [Bradyrhizobiaceae bacterium]
MTPLTSQQRLQHKLGLRPTDCAVLQVGFTTACAGDVAERLERLFARLPNRRVELRPASKYAALPTFFPLNSPDDAGGTTVNVAATSRDHLEISFAPLLWDVFSIVKMVRAALDPEGAEAAAFQHLPFALLQAEASHAPSRVEHALADGLGIASPKHRDLAAPARCCFATALGAVAELCERLADVLATRCLQAPALVRELPAALDAPGAVGNLSYFVACDDGGRPRPTKSLADQLAGHLPLAARADKVAAACGLTILPHVPGVDRVVQNRAPRALAASFLAYPSKAELHLSGIYSVADFDERESAAHFADVMTALRGDNPVRPGRAMAKGNGANTTIAEMLANALATAPHRAAVATGAHTYSRAELLHGAQAIAALIPSGTRQIGLCCANSYAFVAAVVACVLRGVCYLPLDPKAGSVKLRDIVSLSSLEAVLCTAETEAAAASTGATPILISSQAAGSREPIVHAEYPAPIYRIHTSGTTGAPKPVDVSSENLQALFKSYDDIAPDIYRSTWGFTSSIGFDASVKQYLGPLLFGGTVFIPALRLTDDPVAVLRELKANGVGVLNLTPQLLRIAVDAELCDFPFVLVSGDVLAPRLVDEFFARAAPSSRLVNLYGPTETTINATAFDVSRKLRYRLVPIGRALAGSAVEVQDATGKRQPYCAIGSLKIFGDIVTGGHDGVDADRFGWRDGQASYDTGDQCFVWYDDLVYFVGRRDSQVKINGVRVDLQEIAQRIRAYLDVATCYVAVQGSRLLVILRRGEVAAADERIAELGDGSRFGYVDLTPVLLDEIPVNVNGKVDLAAVLASQQQAIIVRGPMEDALDLEVHTMARAVADQRGVGDLGMDDSLFDHGFDSLLTMEFALELNNRFGLDLPPSKIVANPTPRRLAELLRSAQPTARMIHTMGIARRERLFVLLPPVLGSGLIFTAVARSLAASHRVAVCSYPSKAGTADVEEIARVIFSELRSQGLPGYRVEIVGYSMGGSVGFELCRLLAADCDVASLTILDKPIVPRGDLRRQQQAGEKLLDKLLRGREPSQALKAQMLDDLRRNIDATFHYRPRGSIAVPARLFICTQEEIPVRPDEWAPHLRGGLTVVELPCRHEEVLDEPYADTLLAALTEDFEVSTPVRVREEAFAP